MSQMVGKVLIGLSVEVFQLPFFDSIPAFFVNNQRLLPNYTFSSRRSYPN